MYKDYFLRAESEESLEAALLETGLLEVEIWDDGEPFLRPTVEIYVVGIIYEPTGVLDAEGAPHMEPIEGYHANIRGNLTPEQIDILPIIPRPKNPKAVFAS